MSLVGLGTLCSFISCAGGVEVNELFDLFQRGSIVHYIDARCVSADDHDLSVVGIQR